MILYDANDWRSLFAVRGSVFPKAFRWAFLSAVFGFVLKILETQGVVAISNSAIMKENTVYQGFTFVLGFVLVFRASQSYMRYWSSATSVHRMQAEWFDAAASLIIFASTSDKSVSEIAQFQHLAVRLFLSSARHGNARDSLSSR